MPELELFCELFVSHPLAPRSSVQPRKSNHAALLLLLLDTLRYTVVRNKPLAGGVYIGVAGIG
jgi:hypothetical protein